MITRWLAVFVTSPWDEDHHNYGSPLQVTVWRPTWMLMVRPFSDFAQGGDCRGDFDYHGYEKTAKWHLQTVDSDSWARLRTYQRFRWDSRCVICLHDPETCRMCFSAYHECRPTRFGAFPRHLVRQHLIKRRCQRIRSSDWKWKEIDE